MATRTFNSPTVGANIHCEGPNWDTPHDASAGNEGGGSGLTTHETGAYVHAPGGDWGYKIKRGFLVWNTSSLPDGCTILSAKIRLYCGVLTDNISGDPDIVVTGNNQASNTAIVDEDYDQLNTSNHGDKALSTMSAGAWNEITLDASGRNAISKTGYTKFGLRNSRDLNDNPPGLNSGEENFICDGKGNNHPPELVVEYAEKPTVTSGSVSNLLGTTADYSGNVTDDGGGTVSTRGICWSTSSNPTTSDSKDAAGSGTGSFTANLTGLSKGTTYHVRAYATNQAGTSYGADETFTTKDDPTVTSGSVSNNNMFSASYSGNVTDDGDGTVSTRGICWATTENPTTGNSKAASGSGTGAFTANLTNLKPGVTYHVRAYATNEVSTSYGADETFTTFMGGGMV